MLQGKFETDFMMGGPRCVPVSAHVFHTSFDINVVSLDGHNSRGFTNTKGRLRVFLLAYVTPGRPRSVRTSADRGPRYKSSIVDTAL